MVLPDFGFYRFNYDIRKLPLLFGFIFAMLMSTFYSTLADFLSFLETDMQVGGFKMADFKI